MSNDLAGAVAVITGGATGMGLATALAFARRGAAVKGAFCCARAAVPHMMKRGGGAVVNVTSVAAFSGTGSSMAYAASKAALTTLTLSLARALAPAVRVNAVAPGMVATGFGGFTEADWDVIAKTTPVGRLATDEETAGAIVYLATAKALTGQTIVVDGGLVALGPTADS